jgi:hypothetical protein
MRRILRRLARAILYAIIVLLLLFGITIASVETSWGKNQLRSLLVRQANQYLTATLEIGDLNGSLFRGLVLSNIRLSRDGQAIVAIDEVNLDYTIRELVEGGTFIRSIQLKRPRVIAERQADGRWNLATLVKREVRQRERTGPRRSIRIDSIEITDGSVVLKDPMAFGAVQVPKRYERLQMSFAFAYEPVAWRLVFRRASWLGGASDISIDGLTGAIANGHEGWSFDELRVRTAQSAFTVDGRVRRSDQPSVLDLNVTADRLVFQEWASVLPALAKIAIDARFDARLTGPRATLKTDIDLHSNGGDARGVVVLDTTVPGWRGAGALDLTRLDLAPWFNNNSSRQSNISGRAEFDVALRLGRGIPLGPYVFAGSHAAYAGYQADQVRIRGTITEREWRIANGSAVAYGSRVNLSNGAITLSTPHPFYFQGTASGVDLRRLPPNVPVPHVESVLAFGFDVGGQFVRPVIQGEARFEDSEFIGAHVAEGATGWISSALASYRGEGRVSGVNLNRFGAELDIAWLSEPRYAGMLSGRFRVEGVGFDTATMSLDAGGRLERADIFGGTLTDAEVALNIASGSLQGDYNGSFANVDPAIAFGDTRAAASLSGSGQLGVFARDLLRRPPTLLDYSVSANLDLRDSEARGVHVDHAAMTLALREGELSIADFRASSPLFQLEGDGEVGLEANGNWALRYDVPRADLSLFQETLGAATGEITLKGELTGPPAALRMTGDATANRVEVSGVKVLATSGKYDVTFPLDAPAKAVGQVTGTASFIEAFGQPLREVTGTAGYEAERVTLDLTLAREDGLMGSVKGAALLHAKKRALDLADLNIAVGSLGWRLLPSTPPPVLSWDDTGTSITPLTFVDAKNADQRIDLDGTWRPAGGGALRVKATNVFLDTLTGTPERPALYGGVINADATISGTSEQPLVTGQISVTEGRIRRLTYEKLAGRVDYRAGNLEIDVRLDQSPGVWLTANGTIPPTFFDRNQPEKPIDLEVISSDVNLGLLEGLTDRVTEVAGRLRTSLKVLGTTHTPIFTGPLELFDVGFLVTATGARYKNGSATLQLATDRINVARFHLEDRNGSPLEVSGSLGTHQLRVDDLEVDIMARRFEVLRNETGNLEVDVSLEMRGEYDAPRLYGDVAIVGGEIRVDEVLYRTLFQPYSTSETPLTTTDAISALNPWNRLFLDVALHSQNALRLTGENVLVSDNAPLGLGSFNLRSSGDIYLFKEPGQPLSIMGSLDSISGSYSFQGRRFELYPSSSIDFQGDLNPGIFITVNRVISGVETRVTITGTLHEPELRLSSNPPLDPTDILSLIVFNTSANELSAEQQTELAIRAGTLAAGFLTSSLTAALERSLGIDLLEIEPTTGPTSGARITIGEEIAPGLVARFSRQFGTDQYDEATLEYYISRLLRIRATFSDAGSLGVRSPFRRVERAGIDLLLFFSF